VNASGLKIFTSPGVKQQYTLSDKACRDMLLELWRSHDLVDSTMQASQGRHCHCG
jgi:hypothetical protein